MDSRLARILGESPVDVSALGGGGNSRVWKAVMASGRAYSVKEYYFSCADWQNRMETEFEAFSMLRRNGLECVPEPLRKDYDTGLAVYSFEPGHKIGCAELSAGMLDRFFEFAENLYGLANQPGAGDLKPAKAHCLCHDSIDLQLERRVDTLKSVQGDDSLCTELNAFLYGDFIPLFEEIAAWRRSELKKNGMEGYSLTQGEWTLSPSDFGLHNALLQDDGTFIFLDFEYFGRDDPAKMAGDFMLHPAMNLTAVFLKRVYHGFEEIFGHDGFGIRLRTLLPMIGLKWCTIFLNEFLPHGLARRNHAAGQEAESSVVRRRQLDKALRQFHMIKNGYEDYLDVIVSN